MATVEIVCTIGMFVVAICALCVTIISEISKRRDVVSSMYLHFIENNNYIALINSIGESAEDSNKVFGIIENNKYLLETILSSLELILQQTRGLKLYKNALYAIAVKPLSASEALIEVVRLLAKEENRFACLYKQLVA